MQYFTYVRLLSKMFHGKSEESFMQLYNIFSSWLQKYENKYKQIQ